MRVAFLLQDLQLRPGVGAVVAHAAALDGASIVLTREQEHRHWPYPGLEGVRVTTLAEAMGEGWDVAVCTGGATASAALALPAARCACLLVEDDTVDGVSATALPLAFLAPTRAAADLIADLQPGTEPVHVATPVTPAPAAPARTGVLDVAAALAARPTHAGHARAIAAASVVVALDVDPYDSLLLAAASGTPVVTTTTHPAAEAIEHGVDGLLVDPGDTLARDEAVRRAAALTPSPPAAAPPAASIAAALDRVLAAPAPPSSALARRVAADLATAAAEADALRAALAQAQAGPPPPPPPPPSFARRAARAAKRRLKR